MKYFKYYFTENLCAKKWAPINYFEILKLQKWTTLKLMCSFPITDLPYYNNAKINKFYK